MSQIHAVQEKKKKGEEKKSMDIKTLKGKNKQASFMAITSFLHHCNSQCLVMSTY